MNQDLRYRVHCSGALGIVLCVVMLVASTQTAWAQDLQSPISGEVELGFGNYLPDVDDAFNVVGPWEIMYGNRGAFFSKFTYSHYLWREFGALALGVSVGFMKKTAQALNSDGSRSVDATTFRMVPVQLSLIYRFDALPRRWSIPFVPYAKIGLDAYFWWVTSEGGVATWRDPDTLELYTGQNLTWGWHIGFGLQFLLDVLAPSMSRQFDASAGVNNTYLFAEWMYSDVDNFGSDERMMVGGSVFLFGIAFEF